MVQLIFFFFFYCGPFCLVMSHTCGVGIFVRDVRCTAYHRRSARNAPRNDLPCDYHRNRKRRISRIPWQRSEHPWFMNAEYLDFSRYRLLASKLSNSTAWKLISNKLAQKSNGCNFPRTETEVATTVAKRLIIEGLQIIDIWHSN